MNKMIELKATGETITFTKVTTDHAEMMVSLPDSGDGPPTHRHVFQSELFDAMEGKPGLDCGDKKIVLEPVQSFTVPVNTLHRCYAVDGTAIKFKATFAPALNIEYLLTEMFEACNQNNSTNSTVIDVCYILNQIKGEYYLGEHLNSFNWHSFLDGIHRMSVRTRQNPTQESITVIRNHETLHSY